MMTLVKALSETHGQIGHAALSRNRSHHVKVDRNALKLILDSRESLATVDVRKLGELQQAFQEQGRALDNLLAFKQYVHKRLDDAGVPVDPESPHKAEGCRIGGRLDLVLDELAACRRQIEELELANQVLLGKEAGLTADPEFDSLLEGKDEDFQPLEEQIPRTA